MPTKKDGKHEKAKHAVPEVSTFYCARERLPSFEVPDAGEESDVAWRASCVVFPVPFLEWDSEVVDTTDWRPNDVESLYANESFVAKSLPQEITRLISSWKRAATAIDAFAPEEPEPHARSAPTKETEPVVFTHDAKSKPSKPKAPPSNTRLTTVKQFADCQYRGTACVVSAEDARARSFDLVNIDKVSPFCQMIASHFFSIGEQRLLLPKGHFLWELIYPQDETGFPLYNPHGKYIVRLFVGGHWCQIGIDDVVPVRSVAGFTNEQSHLFPATDASKGIWPLLLTKALLQAFYADLHIQTPPVVMALTGWLPLQFPLTWQGLRDIHATRPFCCLSVPCKPGKSQEGARLDSEQRMPESMSLAESLQVDPPLFQFVVCEFEDDPRQVRLKASDWCPVGGLHDKLVLVTSESDAEDEDDCRHDDDDYDDEDDDDDDRVTENGDHEEEYDEEQRSNGDPPDEQQAIRSKCEDESVNVHEVSWPDSTPQALLPRSTMHEYHGQLFGGFWIRFESLTNSQLLTVYMPPSQDSLIARLDTRWVDPQQAYVRHRLSLLRLQLVSRVFVADNEAPGQTQPLIRIVFLYEPCRQSCRSSNFAAPGLRESTSCHLLCVDKWQPALPVGCAPESIYIEAGNDAVSGTVASHSVLMPPGEHWYIVLDDADAGSSLLVQAEDALLDIEKSKMTFMDPAKALEEKGVAVITLEPSDFPTQHNFSVWTKVELMLAEDFRESLVLISHVSDASLRPYLSLTLLQLWLGTDRSRRSAEWSTKTLARLPFLPLVCLPIQTPDLNVTSTNHTIRYLLMLEANVPGIVKGGTYTLQLASLPSGHENAHSVSQPIDDAQDVDASNDESDLQRRRMHVTSLKVDRILRWGGDTSPNAKDAVIHERITVPFGAGDVTATIRVTVKKLRGIYLQATLVAQLPPAEDARAKGEGCTTPEHLTPGAPIDPKEYGGRRNWLSRCFTVAAVSGAEVVTIPHAVLCEASVYILDVRADPHRGSNNLSGGQWILEMFGSGDVEVGSDTMELDLEALVRKSWEEALPQEAPSAASAQASKKEQHVECVLPPSRKERAAHSRAQWLRRCPGGYPSPSVPSEQEAGSDQVEFHSPGRVSSDYGVSMTNEEEETKDVEAVKATLDRTETLMHLNNTIKKFVHLHTQVEPILLMQDPYTVVPISENAPCVCTGIVNAQTQLPGLQQKSHVDEFSVAAKSLGAKEAAMLSADELQESEARWDKSRAQEVAAQERNAAAFLDLAQWCESQGDEDTNVILREKLREGLQTRLAKSQALKEMVTDPERVDVESLEVALNEAEIAEVRVWDKDLIETALFKLNLIRTYNSLEQKLEERSMQELATLLASLTTMQKQLQEKNVPLPPDFIKNDVLVQACEALKEVDNEVNGANCGETPSGIEAFRDGEGSEDDGTISAKTP